jgi:hypothetical protein
MTFLVPRWHSGCLLRQLHEPLEERIPGGWVIPGPLQYVDGAELDQAEQKVIVRAFIHPGLVPRPALNPEYSRCSAWPIDRRRHRTAQAA